jgi:energy-coupling factor transporter ATP-binding protein EcfA2
MGLLAALQRAFSPASNDDVIWGKYPIPDALCNYHFLAAGATGSGKTTLLRILLRGTSAKPGGVLGRVKQNRDTRVVLYDPKVEWNTELAELGLSDRRYILNPFDDRSVGWDIAADIIDESDAQEIAELIIPRQQSPNSFFYDAARALLQATILALITVTENHAERWTLRDVLLACGNVNDMGALIRAANLPTGAVDDFLSAERDARSVRMTLTVENNAYNTLAAAWQNSKRRISLKEFVDSESVLILGASKTYRTALATINRLILRRLMSLTLDHPEAGPERRTWFVLDEFPSLGTVPFLEELATEGRSKGVCLVIGFQHITHLYTLYGHKSEALVDQCWHSAFFGTNGQSMAQWVTQRFAPLYTPNDEKPWIKQQSESVTMGDVMGLDYASKKNGFQCIIKSVKDVVPGPMRIHITPKEGPPDIPKPPKGDRERARFVSRDRSQLKLMPWTAEERKRLGLPEQATPGAKITLPVNEMPEDGWLGLDDVKDIVT